MTDGETISLTIATFNDLKIFKFDKTNKISSSYWMQYDNAEKANVSAKTEGNMEAVKNEWFVGYSEVLFSLHMFETTTIL